MANDNTHSFESSYVTKDHHKITNSAQTGLEFNEDFTIELWVKIATVRAGYGQSIFGQFVNGDNLIQAYYDPSNGKMHIGARSGGNWVNSLNWTKSLTVGTWYHIAIGGPGGGGGALADWNYTVDGTDQGTPTLAIGSASSAWPAFTTDITFGSRFATDVQPLDGKMDDLR